MKALSQGENVNKRTAMLLVGIAAMFAVTFALAAPAQANAETTSTQLTYESLAAGGDEVDAQQNCVATFSEGMTHRAEPYSNSTALGIIPADQTVSAACVGIRGGSYTACGVTTNLWVYVYWNNSWGYAAASCLTSS